MTTKTGWRSGSVAVRRARRRRRAALGYNRGSSTPKFRRFGRKRNFWAYTERMTTNEIDEQFKRHQPAGREDGTIDRIWRDTRQMAIIINEAMPDSYLKDLAISYFRMGATLAAGGIGCDDSGKSSPVELATKLEEENVILL